MKAFGLLASLLAFPVYGSYLFDASGEFIYSNVAFSAFQQPVSISCWYKQDDWDAVNAGIAGMGVVGGTVVESVAIAKSSGAADLAIAVSEGASGNSDAQVGFTANSKDGVWAHIVGTFTSNTAREVSVDGSGTQGADTTSITQSTAMANLIIGNQMDGGAAHADGLVAECGFYNDVLSDVEIDELETGLRPSCVNEGNLLGYYSLATSQSSHPDEGPNGGEDMVVEGTTFSADHPTMTGCSATTTTIARRRKM